jgi:signal transduction histidine kinase
MRHSHKIIIVFLLFFTRSSISQLVQPSFNIVRGTNSFTLGKVNAILKTDLDNSLSADEAGIGKINIVPQDIGRVLLNLYNNAFYAVNERASSAVQPYEPTVSVTTKNMGDKIAITVADNGNGIPQKIIDKIFQPFFTTEPTGQGTGLGLSLSYDIIKVHGGEIKVNTNEGEGTEFLVLLLLT